MSSLIEEEKYGQQTSPRRTEPIEIIVSLSISSLEEEKKP
jgi:hypothetical protein